MAAGAGRGGERPPLPHVAAVYVVAVAAMGLLVLVQIAAARKGLDS